VVFFQYLPLVGRDPSAFANEFAVIVAVHKGLAAADRVCSSIYRVFQHSEHSPVTRRKPFDVVRVVAVRDIGQQFVVLEIPLAQLQDTGFLVEFLEHAVQAVSHPRIGMFFQSGAPDLDIAGANRGKDLATSNGFRRVTGECSEC